jgi:tetratricopeptide (TPR) repeat protein
MVTQLEGPDCETLDLLYNNLGFAYKNNGQFEPALTAYLKAKKSLEMHKATGSVMYATLHQNIGKVYHCLDNLDLALQYLKDALRLRKAAIGSDHADVGVTYTSIAEVYVTRKEFQKAIPYFLEDLAITTRVAGANSVSVASIHSGIGNCFLESMQHDKAMEHYRKAERIISTYRSPTEPDLVPILCSMARIHMVDKRFAPALELYTRAQGIARGSPQHQNFIAFLRSQIDNLKQAIECTKKGLPFEFEFNAVTIPNANDSKQASALGVHNRSSNTPVTVKPMPTPEEVL